MVCIIYLENRQPFIVELGAKRGGTPLLAVATEQGSVHILNTSRRQDWDTGTYISMPRPQIIKIENRTPANDSTASQ